VVLADAADAKPELSLNAREKALRGSKPNLSKSAWVAMGSAPKHQASCLPTYCRLSLGAGKHAWLLAFIVESAKVTSVAVSSILATTDLLDVLASGSATIRVTSGALRLHGEV